jgi:hypothetical protein
MIIPMVPLAWAEGLTVKTAACPVPAVPPLTFAAETAPAIATPGVVNPVDVHAELKKGLAAPAPTVEEVFAEPNTISPRAFVFPVEDSLRPADRLEIVGIIEPQNYIFHITWNRHHGLKLK